MTHSDYRDSGDGVGIGARGTGPEPPDKPSGFRPPPCTGGAGRERAAPGMAAGLSGGAAPKRLRRVAEEAGDAASQMEDATVRAFRDMEDALVEFATTGELSFTRG